jgi:SAM-dependent methyltransferase
VYRKENAKIGGRDVEARYGHAHRYKPTSLKLMSSVGLDAKVLDVGGGDRILDLPDFVNIDTFRYSGFVTVLGDAHYLPFKDYAFDVILCEAVVEHLRKPWVAVEEFYRVLKPNSYIYADVAFMQPVHNYPNHYFNMTKEGVRVLFEMFEEVDSGVQEYQMPSYALVFLLSRWLRSFLPTIDRYAANVEVYDTGIFDSGPRCARALAFLQKMLGAALRFFDRCIKPEKAQEIAAGVYFIGKKTDQSQTLRS